MYSYPRDAYVGGKSRGQGCAYIPHDRHVRLVVNQEPYTCHIGIEWQVLFLVDIQFQTQSYQYGKYDNIFSSQSVATNSYSWKIYNENIFSVETLINQSMCMLVFRNYLCLFIPTWTLKHWFNLMWISGFQFRKPIASSFYFPMPFSGLIWSG